MPTVSTAKHDRGPYGVIIIKEAINFMPGPLLNQLKSGDQLIANRSA